MKDLYDWLNENPTRIRSCPACGYEDDIKFAIHNIDYTGCDFSILCNSCKHDESGSNDKIDEIMDRWHLPRS